MNLDAVFPYLFGAAFIGVAIFILRGFMKHGGFKGMLFGAGIKRTVGEVEGAGRSMMKTAIKVHVLDAAPDKVVGLEFIAKSFGSYQMMPFSMSAAEARRLAAHILSAADGR